MRNLDPPAATPHHERLPGPAAAQFHLSEYFRIIYRRRRLAFAAFCAVVLGAALLNLMTEPVYEATTTLHVKLGKNSGELLEGLRLSRENPIEAEIELLRSRSSLEEVVTRLDLHRQVELRGGQLQYELLEFVPRGGESQFQIALTGPETYEIRGKENRFVGRGRSGERFENELLSLRLGVEGRIGESLLLTLDQPHLVANGLRGRVRAAELGRGTNVIEVFYQDSDPERAKEVLNALVAVYRERSIATKIEEASRSVEFIGSQIEAVRSLLDTAEQNLESFKRDRGVVLLGSEAESLIGILANLEIQRAETSLRRRQAEFAIEALQEAMAAGETYAPSVMVDDPVVAVLGQKLAELEIERRALQVELTPNHPQVQTLVEQIAAVQRKLLATYRSSLAGLGDRAAALEQDLARFDLEMKKMPEAERRLVYLTRIAAVNSEIYTLLLQKHQEARIVQASTISDINIIDPAVTPDQPIKPNRRRNLILGFLVGLVTAAGVALFRDYLDDTLKEADSVGRLFGLPVLAVIPRMRSKEKPAGRASPFVFPPPPRSDPIEAFRSLRAALRFAIPGHDQQVLVITSAFAGEGKTIVAANLGLLLSRTGARVLVIDSHLRRPFLDRPVFHAALPGLAEVLNGHLPPQEVLRTTAVKGFDYIPAGIVSLNPLELLGSDRMDGLIRDFRARYDHILLDAPPMLGVADAALLSAFSDALLVVLESGRVPVKAAQRLRTALELIRIPVVGVVLNDRTGRGAGFYGSNGRDFGCGYGYFSYGCQDEGNGA